MAKTFSSYGTSVAELDAPLIVESEYREQASFNGKLNGLLAELRVGKALVIAGLVLTMLLCSVTFGVVCTALEYSKETYVAEGALMDRATDAVVSTREHEEYIEDPLNAESAQGVQWLTLKHADGGLSRRRVTGYTRSKCITVDDNCNVDGYHYFFMTTSGPYAGTYKAHGLSFVPVQEEYVKQATGPSATAPGRLSGVYRD